MANPALVLATWVIGLIVVIAIGLPLGRLAGARGPQAVRVALWSGAAVVTFVVLVLNLFAPLRGWQATTAIAVLAAFGALVGLWPLRNRRSQLLRGWRSPGLAIWLLVGFAVLAMAIGSSLSPTHYDFGLYHFAMVRFSSDYSTIPGLANLNPYFGYANSEYPLAALLTNGPLGDLGYRALNGLFFMLLVSDLMLRLASRVRRVGSVIAPLNVLVCAMPLLFFADLHVASPASDTALFILTLASTAGLADAVYRGRLRGVDLVIICVPLLIATTMRPQAALVLALSIVVIGLVGFRRGLRRGAGRVIVFLSGLSVALAIAVLARDERLSGWAVYPMSLLRFDVPWATPDPSELRRITVAIARDPGPAYQEASSGWAWLPGWLQRQPHSWEFWLTGVLVVAVVAAIVWAWKRQIRINGRRLLIALTPGLIYVVVWVAILPPTWRHSWGAVFGIGATALGWILYSGHVDPRRLTRAALVLVAVVSIVSLTVRYPAKPTAMPEVQVAPLVLPSGLEILVPVGTDQCWDNDLLCTPTFPEGLRLRSTHIQDGFVVDP